VVQRARRSVDAFSSNGIHICIPLAIGMATAAQVTIMTSPPSA
jgi:hypothetical protein